jgi:YbbR domain-containing protein
VVVNNWRLKLAALGLAIFLWALVQTEPRNSETFASVPVLIEMADTTWTPSGPPVPATAELRLSGPAREIIRLAREGTSIRVPIREVGSPDTVVALRRDWVVLGDGSGLIVESLSPSAVQITLEHAVSRALRLTVRTEGTLPSHLALASPIGLNPTIVRVRGPASRVQSLDSIPLRPIALPSVLASGVFDIPVDTTGLGGIRVVPPNATLGIRVEDVIERVLSGVPVLAQAEAGEHEVAVSPTTVAVTIRGARTLVTAVDPADLRAWVEPELLRGMAVGEARRIPVRLEGLPDLVTGELATAVVTVRHAPNGTLDGQAGVGPP